MKLDLLTIQQMIVQQLPAKVRWYIDDTTLDYDFSAARNGIAPLAAEITQFSTEYLDLLNFGEYDYSEGGGAAPWLCIRKTDGSIVGLDIERENCIFLLNSSIDKFIKTFTLLSSYLSLNPQLPKDIDLQLKSIDAESYLTSDWKMLVDFLLSNPIGD